VAMGLGTEHILINFSVHSEANSGHLPLKFSSAQRFAVSILRIYCSFPLHATSVQPTGSYGLLSGCSPLI
jgi:hypothetical protein